MNPHAEATWTADGLVQLTLDVATARELSQGKAAGEQLRDALASLLLEEAEDTDDSDGG